jgi:hypothetical protein
MERDCSFLIGRKLREVTFDEGRTRLRFTGGVEVEVAGEIEHRVGADTLGRAVPDNRVLPSLTHLVGRAVRQAGREPHGLLLAFDDGHELRVLANGDAAGFAVVSP